MALLDNFKYEIDTPGWRQMSPLDVVASAGSMICCDKRNDEQCDHTIYYLNAQTGFTAYSARYNGVQQLPSPALVVAMAAGNEMVFVPSFALTGTIGAGSSTTKIVLSAINDRAGAMAAVAANAFVTTDTTYGWHIRVINKTTGKTEERFIRGNTASATPTIYLDGALSDAPNSGDLIEIQSGGVYVIQATTSVAGQTRYFNRAMNTWANGGATGITTGAASSAVVLDELYVPYNRKTGEGFLVGAGTYDTSYTSDIDGETKDEKKFCLTATAAAADSITGQTSAGDYQVLQNEYRNFQIRIVEDTGTPAAVGQRRIIKSHTAGANPVYTIGANWTNTPSNTAKYVIENPNVILLQNLTQAAMLTYNTSNATINNGTNSIAAFTWSATYFNNSGATAHAAVVATGTMAFPCYGHEPARQNDGTKLSRHSYNWFFRGGTTLDMFDMAGAASGTWTNAIPYPGAVTFGAGASGDYDPVTFSGEYCYIHYYTSATVQSCLQFNVTAASLVPWVKTPIQAGTLVQGKRVAVTCSVPSADATDDNKLALMFVQGHIQATMYRSDIIG